MDAGILILRDLFSNPDNYFDKKDRGKDFIWKTDNTGTLDILEWEDREGRTIAKPTVFVVVGEVKNEPFPSIGNVSATYADGSIGLGCTEIYQLVFRSTSGRAGEARLLSRIIMTYLQYFQLVLRHKSGGRVDSFVVAGKSQPQKLKKEDNADNIWAADVTVEVRIQRWWRFGSPQDGWIEFVIQQPPELPEDGSIRQGNVRWALGSNDPDALPHPDWLNPPPDLDGGCLVDKPVAPGPSQDCESAIAEAVESATNSFNGVNTSRLQPILTSNEAAKAKLDHTI
jgi:hypothetical protein